MVIRRSDAGGNRLDGAAIIKGGKLSGTRSKKFLVLADLDALGAVPNNGRQTDRARALSKALVNIKELESIELGRWRSVLARGTNVTKTATPFAFSALGAALQIVALSALSDELDKATQSGKNVAQGEWRYRAGWAALAGTTTEVLGKALETMPQVTQKLGRVVGRYLADTLKFVGRGLGVFGAVIVATCDAGKAVESFKEDKKGLSLAYGASAVLGISGALLLLSTAAAASGIGLILILIAFGISFLIDYLRDNPIQEWLSAGYFNQRTFATPEEELKRLKAIGA